MSLTPTRDHRIKPPVAGRQGTGSQGKEARENRKYSSDMWGQTASHERWSASGARRWRRPQHPVPQVASPGGVYTTGRRLVALALVSGRPPSVPVVGVVGHPSGLPPHPPPPPHVDPHLPGDPHLPSWLLRAHTTRKFCPRRIFIAGLRGELPRPRVRSSALGHGPGQERRKPGGPPDRQSFVKEIPVGTEREEWAATVVATATTAAATTAHRKRVPRRKTGRGRRLPQRPSIEGERSWNDLHTHTGGS